MLANDNLPSLGFDRTAQFYNPKDSFLKHKGIKKLQPIVDDSLTKESDLPTFSRKLSQQEIVDFDYLVQLQLQKYCSQPNVLQSNKNVNNLSNTKNSLKVHTPFKSLLGFQQRILQPKTQTNNATSNAQTPERGRRHIKVLLNPFNMERKSQDATKNSSSQSMRPSKSQGRTFLQRKAQVGLLNRIFSSRSQDFL